MIATRVVCLLIHNPFQVNELSWTLLVLLRALTTKLKIYLCVLKNVDQSTTKIGFIVSFCIIFVLIRFVLL